jgi:alanyl-tRNA synthetase
VDNSIHHKTRLNHSATHLLHEALRQVLGEGVQQKGSLVDSQRLRFDFSHNEAVQSGQLAEIQRLVNAQIRANTPTQTEVMDVEAAKNKGAMALFGEKYSDEVRVLSMGTEQEGKPFSIELCGGLHVERTGDIALLHITNETGIASGIRRIEALTGEAALNFLWDREHQLEQAAAQLKARPEQLLERLESQQERSRQLEKEVQQLKKKLASGAGGADLTAEAKEIGGFKVLATRIEGADMKTLRELMDQLKQKLAPAAVVLAAVEGSKVSLVAGMSGDAKDRLHAGKLVNHVAQQIGGKGGGRPDMAQAGGTDAASLPDALASVHAWVAEQLGQD